MLVVGLLKLMPLSAASAFMGWMWRMIAPRLSRQKRALAHLRMAFPEKSEEELHQITLGMWDNLGRTFAEGLMIEQFRKKADLFDFPPGFDALRESLRQTGAVIVSLHSGNWELGGILADKNGYEAAVVYQKLKNPLVNNYVISQRGSTFKAGLFAKGNQAGTRLMAAIKDGHMAAIMGDLREGRGVKVPFLGKPAPSNVFPARMARQLDVPLIALRILRQEGVDFEIEFELIEVPFTDDFDADIVEATTRVQAVFEKWVRAKPEQWMWAHKRWG